MLTPMPEKMIDPTETTVTRRDVLKTCAAGAGILIAAPMLATRALADDPNSPAPAAPALTPDWKDAGAPDDFKANVPKRVDFSVVVAWVTRVDDKTLEAVSAKCTHRGCELGYDSTQSSNLVCPCHGGTFKVGGTNVLGTRHNPAKPLPNLTVLPVQISDGRVQVNIAPAENAAPAAA